LCRYAVLILLVCGEEVLGKRDETVKALFVRHAITVSYCENQVIRDIQNYEAIRGSGMIHHESFPRAAQ
jgi:hypothetical protein